MILIFQMRKLRPEKKLGEFFKGMGVNRDKMSKKNPAEFQTPWARVPYLFFQVTAHATNLLFINLGVGVLVKVHANIS